jgi:hypothetical protein
MLDSFIRRHAQQHITAPTRNVGYIFIGGEALRDLFACFDASEDHEGVTSLVERLGNGCRSFCFTFRSNHSSLAFLFRL